VADAEKFVNSHTTIIFKRDKLEKFRYVNDKNKKSVGKVAVKKEEQESHVAAGDEDDGGSSSESSSGEGSSSSEKPAVMKKKFTAKDKDRLKRELQKKRSEAAASRTGKWRTTKSVGGRNNKIMESDEDMKSENQSNFSGDKASEDSDFKKPAKASRSVLSAKSGGAKSVAAASATNKSLKSVKSHNSSRHVDTSQDSVMKQLNQFYDKKEVKVTKKEQLIQNQIDKVLNDSDTGAAKIKRERQEK